MDRRNFIQVLGGSALSLAAFHELNANAYQSIKTLNDKFLKDNAPDGPYWDGIMSHFLYESNLTMMNNGTVGPIPLPVYNTLMEAHHVQATNPSECYQFFPLQKEAVRRKVARFLHADDDEVAIVRNTTEGMNLIAHGLKLEAGDEILLSSLEHPSGLYPWRLRAKRDNIKLVEVKLESPPSGIDQIITSFENAITPKTKAISISHTVYISGLIFPVKELAEMAHRHGIFVAVDSAHGVGMLDLNLKSLGVDAFASSPYKWGFAPTGSGVFFVRKEAQDRLWPLIVSSDWESNSSAQRFESLGQQSDPLFFGLGEAIKFMENISIARIERRIKALSLYLKDQLNRISKVRLHTSMDPYLSAGLTAFSMQGIDPNVIVDYIREKYNIVIRTIGRDADNTRGVRVSTPITVTLDDVDRLLEGIRTLAKR